MRVAARRGMWGFGVALLLIAACGESSTGAATGPVVVDPAAEVAILAVVEGRVTVRDAQGAEAPARPEQPLTRGDTVVTTPGSLAVVVLANGHVLKLEEDQATPVRALAHLDDPPPAESVAELFEKALGAEAFARVGGAGRLERIAGWNARRASGETPAPVTKMEAPAPVKSAPAEEERPASPIAPPPQLDDDERDRDDAAGGLDAADSKKSTDAKKAKQGRGTPLPGKTADADGAPADPPAPPPEPKQSGSDRATENSKSPTSPPPPGGAPPETESQAAVDLADSWIFETAPDTQVTRTSLPEALKSRRQALAQCVAGALPGVAAPELRLKVVGGVVKEIALGGGKSAPACARELLNQRLAGVADGWVIVRVRR